MGAPYWQDDMVTLYAGDCLDVLAGMADSSIDAVVTDPPYALSFMGREWDSFSKGAIRTRVDGRTNPTDGKSVTATPEAYIAGQPFQAWCQQWATECLRVLKPGGHLLAFGGTRTYHRLACAIEDAGFEIRDSMHWIYGSGFPKSLSVHKTTLKLVELRYAEARCDCLDTRDGRPAGRDARQGSSGQVRPGRGAGQVPAYQAGDSGLPAEPWASDGAVRELRDGSRAQAPGSAPVDSVVLLEDLRGCGTEEAGHGSAAVRTRVEEHQGASPATGRDVPGLRQDPGAERAGAPRSSSGALPFRRHESDVEPDGAVRLLPPRGGSGDGIRAVRDPARSQPRELHADDHAGRSSAVAQVCSWCGLPDLGWLASLEPLGSALKPAHEPIVVARKPLAGTVARNFMEHGTGALNIDGCRVGNGDRPLVVSDRRSGNSTYGDGLQGSRAVGTTDEGRWPPNVVLGAEAAAELDRQSGARPSGSPISGREPSARMGSNGIYCDAPASRPVFAGYADEGGASRFFPVFRYEAKAATSERPRGDDGTAHPTVKPVALIEWLVRLVTPPGGTVLDLFAGSGTTAEACIIHGFRSVLIEKDPAYCELIRKRLSKPIQPDLFGGAA